MKRQIVTIGAGRAVMRQPDNLLHTYILGLVDVARPKVCFLPTASGDLPDYITEFYEAYSSSRCIPTHLKLFYREVLNLEEYLLQQDIIYVGGGNTANMLDVWARHGVDKILRKAWEQGVLLCGGSAGAICWFEGGITDSFGTKNLKPLAEGLGLLPGSICPHYDVDELRRPAYQQALLDNHLSAGYAIDDSTALYFKNQKLVEAVGSSKESKAFMVSVPDGKINEQPLSVRHLK